MAGSAPKKKDAKALIKGASLPERSVEICLQPDLTARMQELERALARAEAERSAAGSLATGGESRALAGQMTAVHEEMLSHSVAFRLRALPRRRFTAMQLEHRPRDDNPSDALAGVNVEAMAEALVKACLFDPVLDDEDWANLDEALSDGQWQMLVNAAWAINARDVDVPFSRTASRIMAASASG